MQADGIVIKESHLRSFAKAFSWRVFGTIISVIVGYLLTHAIKVAISIGFIEFFSKIFLFYFHERLWDLLSWGMHAKPR